ncbi:MAG: putative 4-hydroxybenzoate polyprenyltransferase, partial [Rikenellaceae bacterium]|nr:putative 4-hydroxybenzoate polyprenyltransferase [Rikenellaceae bacterium]
MFARIRDYARLVKFSHTVFAMPFALAAFFHAVQDMDGGFPWVLLLKVLLCMVLARNAAMAFNRYADRRIDALNPRTRRREIPAGVILARSALIFTIVNATLFIAVAAWINPLAFKLSPVALLVVLGYTLTKRFTWLCHIAIGLALSIVPMAAYIAVTGHFSGGMIWLSALVLTWVAGFDIIYSLQDIAFDRANGVFSIPVRLGAWGALGMSAFLHLLTVWFTLKIGFVVDGRFFYR